MSIGKIHPDVAVVEDDAFFAAYVHYLGHPVYKCAAGSSRTSWTFLVPECDFDIMRDEFRDAETSLFLKPYISAFKSVMDSQKLARQSSGEYIAPAWREVIAGRGR